LIDGSDGVFVSSLDSFRSGGTGVAATKTTSSIMSFDEDFNELIRAKITALHQFQKM